MILYCVPDVIFIASICNTEVRFKGLHVREPEN